MSNLKNLEEQVDATLLSGLSQADKDDVDMAIREGLTAAVIVANWAIKGTGPLTLLAICTWAERREKELRQ